MVGPNLEHSKNRIDAHPEEKQEVKTCTDPFVHFQQISRSVFDIDNFTRMFTFYSG